MGEETGTCKETGFTYGTDLLSLAQGNRSVKVGQAKGSKELEHENSKLKS